MRESYHFHYTTGLWEQRLKKLFSKRYSVVSGDRPTDDSTGLVEKKVRDSLSHADRKNLVDSDCPELSLSTQSKLLGVSRSRLYYRAVLPSPEEISLLGTGLTRSTHVGLSSAVGALRLFSKGEDSL